MLAIVPGKAAVAEEVILDTVDVAFELFMGIRAFFMSLSHVSILKPGWFPLQSAIMASEQILTYVHNCNVWGPNAPGGIPC